jgi:hypothetical protein
MGVYFYGFFFFAMGHLIGLSSKHYEISLQVKFIFFLLLYISIFLHSHVKSFKYIYFYIYIVVLNHLKLDK